MSSLKQFLIRILSVLQVKTGLITAVSKYDI